MALNRTAAQSAKANKITSTSLSTGASAAGLATGIFVAATGANAVPVAGQVVGAALALAGVLAKIFIGKKQKKKREAAQRAAQEKGRKAQEFANARAVGASTGQQAAGEGNVVGKTAPVTQPDAPSYRNWGEDKIANIQATTPAQQAVNNSIGINK